MRILVIGSEGNVGRRLVPYFRQIGHYVYCADQIQGYGDNYKTANILCISDLIPIFERFQPEVVYLLAGMVSRVTCEASPGLAVDVNISGTNNVVQLCERFDSKLIFFSTSEVYGNVSSGILEENIACQPNNIYGLTKYLAEQLIKYETNNNALRAVILRPFMLYDELETFGENRSAMIRFAESLIRKNKITVHIDSGRSWLYIPDAVKIFDRVNYLQQSDIINIGHPFYIETKTLAEYMCALLGLNYKEYVIESHIPDRMTTIKRPDLTKQKMLCNEPLIDVYDGIELVIKTVKERLSL